MDRITSVATMWLPCNEIKPQTEHCYTILPSKGTCSSAQTGFVEELKTYLDI